MNSTGVGIPSDLKVECQLCGHDVTRLRLCLERHFSS